MISIQIDPVDNLVCDHKKKANVNKESASIRRFHERQRGGFHFLSGQVYSDPSTFCPLTEGPSPIVLVISWCVTNHPKILA